MKRSPNHDPITSQNGTVIAIQAPNKSFPEAETFSKGSYHIKTPPKNKTKQKARIGREAFPFFRKVEGFCNMCMI